MVFLLAMMETTAKYLTQFYPAPLMVWSRYTVHAVLLLVLLAPRLGTQLVKTQQFGAQVIRGSLLMCATLCNFGALTYLPMAEVKAISFVAPMLVTLMAAWLLAEAVNRARWIAVAAGFFGVLFIVRPGSGMLQWPAILALGSALCYAMYQIMTRKFSDSENPMTTLFYSALVGATLLSLALPLFWSLPQLHHIPLFIFLGMAGATAHYMLIKAMELENASFLSPLGYVQLVWVTIFGFLVFGDFPDLGSFVGMTIIVSSGLYVALGHRFKAHEAPETPVD